MAYDCTPARIKTTGLFSLMAGLCLTGCLAGCQTPLRSAGLSGEKGQIAQAHTVFTVAESKRLIAKAVAKMPIVENALRNGTVIVCKGTTNTYVAEELLGEKIPHGAYVLGHILPEKGGKKLPKVDPVREVVIVKGKHQADLTLGEALKQLSAGDVIIKGGNALDYANKMAGVWTGSPTGGTTGKIMPYIKAGKAHLVIPIGLEKLVVGKVVDIAARIDEPVEGATKMPRMRILPGQILTEIEALRILADVEPFQASAGGIGGAEGAVWMVWRGTRENVERARQLAASIKGEVAFIP
jgi:hypothetical protein